MVNCLRFLNMKSLGDIERMTFYEYALRMKAQRLKTIDEEFARHRQAWVNREVKAEKKKGKHGSEYVYKRFDSFFDYKKLLVTAGREAAEEKPLSDTAARYMEFMRRKRESEPSQE